MYLSNKIFLLSPKFSKYFYAISLISSFSSFIPDTKHKIKSSSNFSKLSNSKFIKHFWTHSSTSYRTSGYLSFCNFSIWPNTIPRCWPALGKTRTYYKASNVDNLTFLCWCLKLFLSSFNNFSQFYPIWFGATLHKSVKNFETFFFISWYLSCNKASILVINKDNSFLKTFN